MPDIGRKKASVLKRKKLSLNTIAYTKVERVGTAVLAVLLVLCIVVPPLWRRYVPRQVVDSAVERMAIEEYFASLGTRQEVHSERMVRLEDEEVETPTWQAFAFNPNTISADSLLLLGLTAKQAAALVRYRNAGGVFRRPSDMEKLRAIDASTRQRLVALVHIPETTTERKSAQTPRATSATQGAYTQAQPQEAIAQRVVEAIDLNAADTAMLRRLRGIGAVLSQRIVDYRQQLGGFHHVEQLLEVRGIKPELIDRLRSQLHIDTTAIQRIDLNTATLEQLQSHPYINSAEAKGIVYYRATMGRIAHPNVLTQQKLVAPERFARLKPYIFAK